jgi:hypothetical protein
MRKMMRIIIVKRKGIKNTGGNIMKCDCGINLVSKQEKEDGKCNLCKGEDDLEGGEKPEIPEKSTGSPKEKRGKKKVILINCDNYEELYDKVAEDARKNFRNVSMQAMLALAEKYKIDLIKGE